MMVLLDLTIIMDSATAQTACDRQCYFSWGRKLPFFMTCSRNSFVLFRCKEDKGPCDGMYHLTLVLRLWSGEDDEKRGMEVELISHQLP